MAIPKPLESARSDERAYLISLIDNKPLSGVDSSTYGKTMESIFILKTIERLSPSKFATASQSIESESVSVRAELVNKYLDFSKETPIGSSLSILYHYGVREIRESRKLGANLLVIDVAQDFFNSEHISYSIDGTEILIDPDTRVWGDGSFYIMFKFDGATYIANESSHGSLTGVRKA